MNPPKGILSLYQSCLTQCCDDMEELVSPWDVVPEHRPVRRAESPIPSFARTHCASMMSFKSVTLLPGIVYNAAGGRRQSTSFLSFRNPATS